MYRNTRTPHALRVALAVVCVASLLPLTGRSQSGILRFSGAITEPMCQSSIAPTSSARGAGLRLNMNCHTDQSVQVAFENTPTAQRHVTLSHAGRPLREGEQLPLALKGRQNNHVDLDMRTHDKTNAGTTEATPLLVTLTYR